MYPLIIIGAGASGLAAAIAAARVRPHSVLLLEKEARVGRKLLATGNGRCNLLNAHPTKSNYYGSGAYIVSELLRRMPPASLLKWFGSIGLSCRQEAEGRIYPYSGQASTVVDVLRAACARYGVDTQVGQAVTGIEKTNRGYTVHAGQQSFSCERLLIAGGGKASPLLGSDGSALSLLEGLGHTVAATMPAIAPIMLPPAPIRGLKGVRTQARLRLLSGGKGIRDEAGEILFTDYGVSGIAAMQLARHIHAAQSQGHRLSLSISLMDKDLAERETTNRHALFSGLSMEQFMTGLLHKRLSLCLLREAQLSPQDTVTERTARTLCPLLSDWRIPVQGTLSFDHAQVTAGGALLSEFDPDTLGSYLCPGLYACGEVLDVDGDCGGFNLMWAWASGIIAGQSAALAACT